MVGKAHLLLLQAAALDDNADLDVALETWGAMCDAAEEEIADPGAFTDIAGLASIAANGRLRRGDYYELLGDSAAAAEERRAASALVTRHGDLDAQLEVRRTLANSLKYQARYGEALAELVEVEAKYDPQTEPIEHARIVLDQAMLLEWLGDFERAEAALARAETSVFDQLGGTPASQGKLATILAALADPEGIEAQVQLQGLRMEFASTRGLVAKRSGRYNDARRYFRAIRDEYVQRDAGPTIDFHLMHLDALEGRGREALVRLNALDAAFRADARLHAKIPVLHWIASLAMLDSDPGWALDRIDDGIPTLAHVADYETLWKLYRTSAHALQRLGRNGEATGRFLNAARVIDQTRRMPLGYRLESTYFADRAPMFSEAIEHVATIGDGLAAFELSELAKSRSLATLIYGTRRSRPDDPKALHIEHLSRQIDAWDFRNYNGAAGDPAERAKLIADRADAIEQVRVSDPRWRALSEPRPVSVTSIADVLDGAIAVSLFIQDRTVVAVSVEASGVSVDSLQVDGDVWDELNNYEANVRRAEDPYAYDLSGFGEVGLRDLLPGPTCERIVAHGCAVIAPHGLLHLVPWSTLDLDGDRLFQRVGVTTVPNLMCIPALVAPWAPAPSACVVGAPNYENVSSLDAVDPNGHEYNSICETWTSANDATLAAASFGSDSTEAALLGALATDVDVLHISCHGVIDHGEPSASALIAADGKVDAAEIALGGSCPDEVVLAACSTGYRPAAVGNLALSGDDIVGMPAAFLETGARSVLMSIPKAHEETSVQFMTRYHQARAGGAAPVDAYRSTQIEMLDVADPALWCGYTLYGSPSRHFAQNRRNQ